MEEKNERMFIFWIKKKKNINSINNKKEEKIISNIDINF